MAKNKKQSKSQRTVGTLIKKVLNGDDKPARAQALFRLLMELEDELCDVGGKVADAIRMEAALTTANRFCPKES
jgi:hypothetical protein